jgi:hypothetical protein
VIHRLMKLRTALKAVRLKGEGLRHGALRLIKLRGV